MLLERTAASDLPACIRPLTPDFIEVAQHHPAARCFASYGGWSDYHHSGDDPKKCAQAVDLTYPDDFLGRYTEDAESSISDAFDPELFLIVLGYFPKLLLQGINCSTDLRIVIMAESIKRC